MLDLFNQFIKYYIHLNRNINTNFPNLKLDNLIFEEDKIFLWICSNNTISKSSIYNIWKI